MTESKYTSARFRKATENEKNIGALIIDDDEGICKLLAETLEEIGGFTVFQAAAVLEAQKLFTAQNDNIHLVLLDLILPEIRGEEFLDWIKVVSPETAVVIITGDADEDAIMRCLNLGASEFLRKPFGLDVIRNTVDRVLKRLRRGITETREIIADQPADDWVELTAPSEFKYLSRMQRFTEILFDTRLPKNIIDDLRMTIEEVGRNAIEWGNRMNRAKKFSIAYCIFSDRIVLKFEDEGEGFRPGDLPDPSANPHEHLRKRSESGKRPGGFGVYLVQNIMDDVHYNARGNVVLMTKFFRP